MKFKKSELIPVLSQFLVFDKDTKTAVSGLLTEDITLGLKRRIQKLRTDVLKHYEELVRDEKEVREKATPENLEVELKELFNEEVEVNQEFLDISFIEAIKTSNNYDFSIIEKFAQ